jgi:hypothetical protein
MRTYVHARLHKNGLKTKDGYFSNARARLAVRYRNHCQAINVACCLLPIVAVTSAHKHAVRTECRVAAVNTGIAALSVAEARRSESEFYG